MTFGVAPVFTFPLKIPLFPSGIILSPPGRSMSVSQTEVWRLAAASQRSVPAQPPNLHHTHQPPSHPPASYPNHHHTHQPPPHQPASHPILSTTRTPQDAANLPDYQGGHQGSHQPAPGLQLRGEDFLAAKPIQEEQERQGTGHQEDVAEL